MIKKIYNLLKRKKINVQQAKELGLAYSFFRNIIWEKLDMNAAQEVVVLLVINMVNCYFEKGNIIFIKDGKEYALKTKYERVVFKDYTEYITDLIGSEQ